MKLKATQTLVDFINNQIKNNAKYAKFKNYEITLEKMTIEQLERRVDFDARYSFNYDADYNYKTGKYNIIMITYPFDFYAMPHYVTTHDLSKCFKNYTQPLTVEKFLDGFFDEIEI